MRSVLLLLFSALVLAVRLDDATIRFGKTIPVHIPTQSVDSNETFEVPAWLGVYYATVNVSSTWTLPLTIGNGGQTYPGEFLIIRNYGPADITLQTQTPETIEGVSSYLIQPGTIIEILSGYPDWTVISASSGQQQQNIYMFEAYDSFHGGMAFTIEIGPNTYNQPLSPVCVGSSLNCSNWYTNSIGKDAGRYNTGSRVNNIGLSAGWNNTGSAVNNFGTGAGGVNSGNYVNNIGHTAGAVNTVDYTNNMGALAGQYNSGGNTNNLGYNAGRYNTGFASNNIGSSAGTVNTGMYSNNLGSGAGTFNTGSNANNIGFQAGRNNTGSYCSHNGNNAGLMNTYSYCYTNGRESVCTASNQFVIGSSTYPMNLQLPSNTGSFCTGASYDTCISRAAANAWTFNAGTSLRVPQALNLGSTAAPANLATGAFSTTTASPTLQAFGAVTANAASGMLAFTVSTAAATCSTATVTNTNVATGSQVQLTIQSYTGTEFTNGLPVVSRFNTAGSSSGSFVIKLCNYHATNALSGNLYIAFWVLN